MKVCIYGAGAIGGYLGAALARAPGIEVTLIAHLPKAGPSRSPSLSGRSTTSEPTATIRARKDPGKAKPAIERFIDKYP